MSKTIEGKEFWKKQLEQSKASGLSRTQYCRENNVNYRFGYWLKRLSPVETPDFISVKLHAPELKPSHSTICTQELRGHILKIHDLSALSFVIERLT